MNRETKRMMQRQGYMEEDGSPSTRRQTGTQTRKPAKRRASAGTFVREIRDEMRQVAWPTRAEMVNYTSVVLTTLVLMITLIFLLNYGFGKAIEALFSK